MNDDKITADKITADKITADKITADKITADEITDDEIDDDEIDDDEIIDKKIDTFTYTDKLIRFGKRLRSMSEGKRALKYFIRAGELMRYGEGYFLAAEIYRYGCADVEPDVHKAIELYKKFGKHHLPLLAIAEIYTEGWGDIVADGYEALKIYRQILRGNSRDPRKEERILREIFGDKIDDLLEWSYPYKTYLDALCKTAEIFRYGKGGVPVNGRNALHYYKRIVKTIFDTPDINSLEPPEKFKRIFVDGENGHRTAKALAEIGDIYGYGEAGIRPNQRKAEKFYDMATYVRNGYLYDENFSYDFLRDE